MNKVILINKEDYNSFIDETKYDFIKNVFLNMGLPVEECFAENYKEQSVDQKIKLREFLKKFNVLFLEHSNEKLEIIVDRQVVAKWDKPFCVLKKDLQELDLNKKYYLEVKLNCYSVFDEQ